MPPVTCGKSLYQSLSLNLTSLHHLTKSNSEHYVNENPSHSNFNCYQDPELRRKSLYIPCLFLFIIYLSLLWVWRLAGDQSMIQSNSIFKHRPRNNSFPYLIIDSYYVYNISISNYIVSTHHLIVHCLIYVLYLFIVGVSSPSTFMLTFHYWSPLFILAIACYKITSASSNK